MKLFNCAKIRLPFSNEFRAELMLIGFVVAVVLGSVQPANGATIAVGPGAAYDFDSIQSGIDAADDEDTVLVAPGEYVITEPITFRGMAITVMSETGSDETTIRMGTPADPERASIVVFENNETSSSVLEGFTITGGSGSKMEDAFLGDTLWGGGILFDASSGTLRNCTIVQNQAEHGGGVMVYSGSSTTLINCAVMQNTAKNGGGGMVYSGSSTTLTNCIIRSNSATGTTLHVSGYGGGFCFYKNSSLTSTMTNCIVAENSVGVGGGGVYCNQTTFSMTDCIISRNSAALWGGGVVCNQNPTLLTMTNCVIMRNTAAGGGGGVTSNFGATSTVSNCTIWGNSGGGDWGGGGVACWNGSSATVTNSIICTNTSPKGPEISLFGPTLSPTLTVAYSDIAGGEAGVYVQAGSTLDWGEGNITDDPLFTDPNNNDYHLMSQAGRWDPNSQTWVQDAVTSPCIDAGDHNSSVAFEPYPNGGIINIGAYGSTAEASKSPSGLHAKYGGGTGEPNDPYLLYTDEHLNALGAEPNDYDKHFKLMADIDLSDVKYDAALIAPDINDVESGFQDISFTGVFDGNGHVISHLTIAGMSYLGIFGQLESGAEIRNLGVVDVNIVGSGDYIGALAGYSRGHVTMTYSTGMVHGDKRVGGLMGRTWGEVTLCYSTVTVTGSSDVGGLAGNNYGDIMRSYSTGEVAANSDVGGFIGENYGSIDESYSTGVVIGDQDVGGLVGYKGSDASANSSFWDVETSGQSTSKGGTGKTTAEMQERGTFILGGWDFVDETDNGTEDIWWIDEGNDYPHLRCVPEN